MSRNRIQDDIESLVEDFGITREVVPKADEDLGVWHYINQQRERQHNLHEALKALNRKVNGVKNAQGEDWTRSGIWRVVQDGLNARKVRWVDMAIKGLVAAGATSIVGGLAWLVRMAWIGINAKH